MMMSSTQAIGLRRMWQAVLVNALRDAAGLNMDLPGARLKIMRDVDAWIRTSDFGVVCSLAGFDVEATRERFRDVIASGQLRERLSNVRTGFSRPLRSGPHAKQFGVAA